jgi:succinyl-CoA synthetase beta subunit
MTLVTHQTGPEGKKVHKIFIEQGCNIAKEYYVACLVDRATGRVAMMASSEGGMDIEEVAEKHPEAIKKVDIEGLEGFGEKSADNILASIKIALPILANRNTSYPYFIFFLKSNNF